LESVGRREELQEMPLIEQLLGEMDEKPEEAKKLARRIAADIDSEGSL